jgi:hypothetical protein
VGGDRADLLELARDGLALTWRGRVGETPIGVRFDRALGLSDDAGMTIRVRADGRDLPPDAIVVGPGDGHPPTTPFTYKVVGPDGARAHEAPPLIVREAPVPAATADQPVRVYLWRHIEPPPASVMPLPPDETVRERLRALGYVQ